jgi:hypothetical protein
MRTPTVSEAERHHFRFHEPDLHLFSAFGDDPWSPNFVPPRVSMGGSKTKKLEPRLKPRTGPPPREPVGLSAESAAIWESETRSRSRSPGRLALLERHLDRPGAQGS